ncbi:MAG: hypothetical protein J4N34_05470, partial [Chloroflexi bacterium]|nr:hypothetical protein [Chloroflexota bacterium]
SPSWQSGYQIGALVRARKSCLTGLLGATNGANTAPAISVVMINMGSTGQRRRTYTTFENWLREPNFLISARETAPDLAMS